MTDNPASEIAEMVERLIDEALGVCEPENADDTATAYTRKVLARKFTAVLSASAADVERLQRRANELRLALEVNTLRRSDYTLNKQCIFCGVISAIQTTFPHRQECICHA